MEEKSSNYDIIFNLLWLIGVFLCIFLFLFYLFSPLNTKALTEYDITTSIYTVSECEPSLTPRQGYYCAADSNVTNDVWSRVELGSNHAAGDYVRSIGFKVNTGIGANKRVTIQLKGARYNNVSYYCHNVSVDCSVYYVDYNQLNINFTTGDDPLTYSEFRIYANSGSFNGNNLFYISQVKLLTNDISSGGSGGSSGSTFDDTGIINNANQNTQDIIENNNSNTNTLWEVIHGVTNELINMCPNLISPSLFITGMYAESNGDYVDKSSISTFTNKNVNDGSISLTTTQEWWGTADTYYIPVTDSSYYLKFDINLERYFSNIYFYNASKEFISYNQHWNSNSYMFNVPAAAKYMRVGFSSNLYGNITISHLSLTGGNTSFCPYGSNTNKLDELNESIADGFWSMNSTIEDTTDAVRDVNDTLTDSSIEEGLGESYFEDFDSNDPGGISDIVTKPLIVINTLLSNNNLCRDLPIPSILGSQQTYLPSGCIFWNHVPNTIITLWNIFVTGACSYVILIDLFKLVENLKTPTHNKIEVLDL